MSSDDQYEAEQHLGFLLKHVQTRFTELHTAALEPFGVNGRELAVLLVLNTDEPPSQQQAAQRLGVDRTTMVALIDALEDKGLVERRPAADDRRKNVVEFTAVGRDTLHNAIKASDDAERRFLAPLGRAAAHQLRDTLRALID